MKSKQRVLKVIKGLNNPDRIPVYLTLNGIQPKPAKEASTSIVSTAVPENRNLELLRDELRQRGDLVHLTEFPEFDRRFLLIPKRYITLQERKQGKFLLRDYQIQTPKGPLNYREKKEEGIDTTWTEQPLLQSKEDVEKILSVPWDLNQTGMDRSINQYREHLEDPDKWVSYIWISTPLVCVSHMFSMETFLKWVRIEKDLLHKMISIAFERIYQRLEYVLNQDIGDIYRFGGSEQATPPFMSPDLYDEFVVQYDKKLFNLVHSYGKLVQVHCHGKVRSVLTKMKDMGVDATDPLEPPPQGDVLPHEALRLTNGQIAIVGNLEFRDLVQQEPRTIKAKTKTLIKQTKGKNLILASSANPIAGISDKLFKNYMSMLDAVEEMQDM